MGRGCGLLASALALLTLLPSAPGSRSDGGGPWTPRAREPARGVPGDQERSPQGAPFEITSCWSSGGPGPHRHPTCVVGEADGTFQRSCPAGPCSLKAVAPSCAVGPPRSAGDQAPEQLPRTDVSSATVPMGTPLTMAMHAQTSTPASQSAILPSSPHGPPPGPLRIRSPVTSHPGDEQLQPCAQRHPGPLAAPGPEDAAGPVTGRPPQAPLSLGFRIQMAPEAALCLVMDFGDGSGVQMRLHRTPGEVAVTAHHQYSTGGVYALEAAVHAASPGAALRLGPYFLAMGHEGAAVTVNSSSVHGGQVLAFGGSPAGPQSTVVTRRLSPMSTYNVSFASQAPVAVQYQMQPVSVHTNGTVFATDADVTFVAVTEETTPLEFTWLFGAAAPVRTTRRSIRRRLGVPQGYRVVVQASNGLSSVASQPHLVRAQRRVVANRLVSASWAPVGAAVAFECRLSFGTDVAYRWDFGDGAGGLGNSSASHVYSREGAVTVRVLAFNAVSAASLTKRLFVVRRPCQPPPVRSPLPGRVQVWRSQPVTLGVTFEAAVLCDIAQGLSYTWTFTDSAGLPVPLPPAVQAHRQTVTVPSYSLEPGNYTALAKVQVEGSAVHSNYCVEVEVRSRAPVSVISEGTHLFVPRTPSSTVVLRGSLSYDPDRPGAALRYHWTCSPASTPGRPCFAGPTARSLDTGAPTLSFEADSLSSSYDQFLVTLTVSSHGRNSSEAQVFLSTLPDSALRLVSISWVTFRGIPVNWNEGFSLRAACEDCGEAATLSYSWDLFRVNATGRDREEVPFCRTVGLLGSSGLGAGPKSSESYPPSLGPSRAEPRITPAPSGRALWPQPPGWQDLSAPGRASVESTDPVHRVPEAGDTAVPDGGPWDVGTPVSPTPPPPDFEAHYSDIQEAAPAEGRWPADWTQLHLPAPGPSAGADESRGDGDNLLGPLLPTRGAGPALLVDWPKSPVSQAVFQGYTASGATAQTLTVKPHALSPGATYVLQATVASGLSFRGKAQLYLTVSPAPRDVACQVQPPLGLEAHTVFSVFCTSGRPDFRYEFSYRVGNATARSLYRGTDAQHYFALPAGEPGDGHRVLVSTVITDGEGSQTQPCATAVTVLPRRHGDRCPGEDVYRSSLKNLSALRLMGRAEEIRNYVSVTTSVLSRWAKGGSPSCGLWPRLQDALISAACASASRDQGEMADSVLVLRDLLRFPNKLSLASADLILRYARSLLAPGRPSAGFVADTGRVRELVLLVAGALEGTDHTPPRGAAHLLEEGVQVISDALLSPGKSGIRHKVTEVSQEGAAKQKRTACVTVFRPSVLVWTKVLTRAQEPGRPARHFRPTRPPPDSRPTVSQRLPLRFQGCLSAGRESQLHVSAGQMEFRSQLHRCAGSSELGLGPVRVQLPADLASREARGPCYVSQLALFRGSPAPWGRVPGQVGAVLALSLSRCSGRRPLRTQRLRTPVTVEFGEEDGPGGGGGDGNETAFVLPRDRVNVHRLAGLSAAPPESLQIRVRFSRPAARAFPVMLLVRLSEKPTPSRFLVKHTHSWAGLTAHVSVPAASLRGPTQGFLSLLDADYDRDPPHRHLAEAVSYTLRVQGVRCLLWDARWGPPESLPPQPGASPGKVSCSYDRPAAAFSVARRDLNATLETGAVSELRGQPANPRPGIVVAACALLYTLLAVKCRRMDRRERRRSGHVFLQEHTPPGHQLYAVVVDTGFRAPARLTAKVYVVLCGDDGVSEPRELYCPGKPLFERNSRHTFVLSTPAPLGPLRKVRLWHDSRGASPAWFVSHVMVQELRAGPGLGRGWFFPAECWLAAGPQDGRVERELACLRGGPGFRKLLYSKFTELLEDFHVWASVHSRPAGRGPPRTPRLSVAFALLFAHACLAALVAAAGHEQLPPAAGPARVPLGLFRTGFLCTLLASPGAQLLSLLFRLGQEARGPRRAQPPPPLRAAPAAAPPGPGSRQRTPQARTPPKQNASATLSRAAQAPSAASGDREGHLSPDLEARGTDLGQQAPRERSGHCVLGSQAPSCAFEGLATSRRPREPPLWLGSAAWAVCGTVSVACGLGTGLLGYRFGPARCEQWLGLLAVSVTCCVFVTQPLMIGLVALGFAWKRRSDENFFVESLREATEGLDAALEGRSRSHAPPAPSGCGPRGAGSAESVLAARQRARRLRWARPPSPAQLRVTRERMRRRTRTQEVLRDAGLSALMLLLHLCVTHGEAPREEHALHRAIRDAFARSTRSLVDDQSGVDAWWAWSLSTLLDGLYPESGPAAAGTPGAQPGALGGKCYLLGLPVLRQLKAPPGSLCELPWPHSVLTEDPRPARHPETPSTTDAEDQKAAPRDPEDCGEGCELCLGRTRPAARAVLTSLRARRWVDRCTRAVSVRFALYSPPTRLFSSVTLSAQLVPAGSLALSTRVESVPIFHSDSAPRFRLLLAQLALLALTLAHLSLQLHGLAEKGVRDYWRRPGTWLELPIAGAGLAWYAACGRLLSLTAEATDQLQQGLLPGSVDLGPVASWAQRARWLQGALSFLLALRCLRPLGWQSAMASRSLSGGLAPVVRPRHRVTAQGAGSVPGRGPGAGRPLPPARNSVCHPGSAIWHLRGCLPPAAVPFSGKRPQRHLPGPPQVQPAGGVRVLRRPSRSRVGSVVCDGACPTLDSEVPGLRGSLRAFTPKRKSFRRRSLVTLGDLMAYAWEQAGSALGLRRPALEEEEAGPAASHARPLDEFAGLLDELLRRVEGLSDSPRLPPGEWQDAPVAGAEGGHLVAASDGQATGGRHGFESAETRADVKNVATGGNRDSPVVAPVPSRSQPLGLPCLTLAVPTDNSGLPDDAGGGVPPARPPWPPAGRGSGVRLFPLTGGMAARLPRRGFPPPQRPQPAAAVRRGGACLGAHNVWVWGPGWCGSVD
ncbi:polycystin-1-like protein 1 [Glossophaga mutica]